MSVDRRVIALNRHLSPSSPGGSARDIYLWLTRDNVELRGRMLDFLKGDLYKPHNYLSLKDFRALTLERMVKFTEQRFFRTADYLEDPLRFLAALECMTFVDYSLSIKSGVHFSLCGGTICKLGTAKHHQAYLPGMDTLEYSGCFAMTELQAGSNVMGIGTQAIYDPASDSFIINTPTNTASKFWIGGAGTNANISTVFAQLTVNGKWEGPHVFVVRLRDASGQCVPGVRIKDNGPKAGLNGVDNGQIWFDHLRVPRDSLLDRFASVSADGVYSSPIPSISQRFGTMVGGLTAGRILIAQGAIDAAKQGVTIAIRYACMRPQFDNKLIMDYLTHQRRLIPSLATTYAMHIALLRLKAVFMRKDPKEGKLLHILSSGLKAGATWSRAETLQLCRECCGGQGFLSENKIGNLKNDTDIDVTFEGDNTVMMQQVAKTLLDTAMRSQPQLSRPAVSEASLTDPATLIQLLRFREEAQTAEVADAMRTASRAAASNGKKAAQAATAAYEDNLDTAVALGWSYVERVALEGFIEELASAPAAAAGALRRLAVLYGLTRVERGMAFFLASGALIGAHAAAVRREVNASCRSLAAENGRALRLLCDGFGIPEELIHAPIATDWRSIGTGPGPM